MLVRSGAVDVVAVDSVAALTPRAELEGQMGDQTVGLQARMMSQAMRKLAGNLNRTQTLCMFTNQIREKVGVMFGSPETQPGGRALKFYSSQRLDIRRIETLKDGTEAVGNRVRVKVVKNKVAAPFRQAEFEIEFGKGISTTGCLIDLGIEHNIVTKSGSFFSYGDERLGQGRNNAKAFLDEHPEIAKEIEDKIYAALGIDRDLVAPIERGEGADAAPRRRWPAARPPQAAGGLSRPRRATARPASCAPARARPRLPLSRPPRPDGARDAPHLEGKRVEPSTIDEALARARPSRATWTTRASRAFAEDRRPLDAWGADRIERGCWRSACAAAVHRGGRWRARPAARSSKRPSRCCARRFRAPETTARRDRAPRRARAQGLRPRARVRRDPRATSATRPTDSTASGPPCRRIAPRARGTTIHGSERLAREGMKRPANTPESRT